MLKNVVEIKQVQPRMNIELSALHRQYVQSELLPSECMATLLKRIEQVDRPEIWIARVRPEEILTRARELDQMLRSHGEAILEQLPLFGIPFAVKDNIDVAGMPTTAACPAFAYTPTTSSTVVTKLLAAGAMLIGKTNLDQFATGLVGTRSPYGAVRNAVDPQYVSGGSSSGSAVAVAMGLVTFSLGTDTAGSGRVPAGLNGIVGLKPTRGLVSTQGVVAACRTLDCVSIFSRKVMDAWAVLQVVAGFDAQDGYSRRVPMLGPIVARQHRPLRVAIPAQLEFFGDARAEQAYSHACAILRGLPNCEVGSVDYTSFKEAAQLLYQGPWVAERLAGIEGFFYDRRDEINDVVGGIISQGENYSAVDTFNGQYRMADLRRTAENVLADYDFMIVPTTPTMPTISDVEKEPVKRNAELGHYTNFVNFFDMAALSIPVRQRSDGLPSGITLIGPCGSDHRLAALADTILPHLVDLGNVPEVLKNRVALQPLPFAEPTVELAVVGAHLEGQPLNWQLVERGARKIASTYTAPHYRLYALSGTTPPKPGLARVSEDGVQIKIEVWEIPARNFGEFIAEVSAPLAIGSIEIDGGRWIKGFVCEPVALSAADDISSYRGWRAFLER